MGTKKREGRAAFTPTIFSLDQLWQPGVWGFTRHWFAHLEWVWLKELAYERQSAPAVDDMRAVRMYALARLTESRHKILRQAIIHYR